MVKTAKSPEEKQKASLAWIEGLEKTATTP